MERVRARRLGQVGGWLGSLATLTLAVACGSDGDPGVGVGGQSGAGNGSGETGGMPGSGGFGPAGSGGSMPKGGAPTSGGSASGGASSGTGGAIAGSGGGGRTGSGGRSASGGRTGSGGSAGKAGGTGTGGAATGGSAGASVSVADEYVTAHNAVRAAVTEPANYSGTWAPLPPVTWSETVAATAQAWAEHLRDTENCGLVHASGTGYGENLASGSGKMTPTRAVELWANEKANYTYNPKYAFMSNTGHYTQIVWRTSVQIGCGSAMCGNSTVICCRYSPAGNYIGKAPY